MFTRIFTLFVVAMLALPLAEATHPVRAGTLVPDEVAPPVQASLQVPHEAAPSLEAKRKKKKPKFRTVTRTVRQPVTQTFSNTGLIKIPATGDSGPANPYPSAINVAGFANGAITDVNLTLNTYSHAIPTDVDVLLVPVHLPNLNAIVMSDTCSTNAVVGITLTLDDQAAAPLPNGTCVSGTFQPTNLGGGAVDPFLGQTPSGNSLLGVFNNANPNGSWQLFVVDDVAGGDGQFAGGWTLQITAEADVQIQEQVKIKPKKKKHKKR